MKLTVNRKIKVGCFAAFILLAASFLLSASSNDKRIEHSKWVSEKNKIIDQQEFLLSALKEMETVYRGYLFLNSGEKLDGYYTEKVKADACLKMIGYFFRSDSMESNRLFLLHALINQQILTFSTGLAMFAASGLVVTDSVKNISFLGKKLMDTVRSHIASMQGRQRSLIKRSNAQIKKSPGINSVINIVFPGIALLIIVFSITAYLKQNRARIKIAAQASLYQTQLQQKVEALNDANTALKALNELKRIEKFSATGRMARMIAHEVRNPLTNIGLASEQLKEFVAPNEESDMLLKMIKSNGARINQLISELLVATRFAELSKAEFAVDDLMDKIIDTAQNAAISKNVRIEKYFSSKSSKVVGDAEKLRVAFLNIIMNAIEAVRPGGVIKISTVVLDNMAKVTITDDGKGMNAETVSKLFEPFFTSKNHGNGLSLTNTQNIILNHKGNISVESTPGTGSAFTIHLPVS